MPTSTQQREVELARRLNDLHEMLYRRGGVRPVNAAIEEISKLLLLLMWLHDSPESEVPGFGKLNSILNPSSLHDRGDTEPVRAAFRQVITLPDYAGRLPDGGTQPVWPSDEPLRISRSDVIAEAIDILRPLFIRDTSSPLDPLGTAFDVFLRGRYDHSGGLGTYLTPNVVTNALALLAIELAGPLLEDDARQGPVFGDPCCGTGRFLVAVLEALREQAFREGRTQDIHRFTWFRDHGIFGADQSSSAVAKARLNLLLYGARHPNIFQVDDSIVDPHLDKLSGTLRLILTNPPFGEGKYDSLDGIARTSMLFPGLRVRSRIDPALAFIARCIELLEEGGILGIILPDGLIDGTALRRALKAEEQVTPREISIEANISLPTATFALSGTVARTSAVILRRGRPRSARVYVARSEHVGYLKQAGGAVVDPSGSDLELIAQTGVDAFSTLVSSNESASVVLSDAPLAAYINRSDLGTLDPSRLDQSALRARSELREYGAVELGALITPTKQRRTSLNPGEPFVSVLHVDELGAVSWHDAESYRPSTPGQLALSGELIVSLLNPRKLRASVIPNDYPRVQCSAEFGVFQAKCDPYAVLALLYDPRVQTQLAPLGRGTSSSRRRIEASDVMELLVPDLEESVLDELGAKVRFHMNQLRIARAGILAAYRRDIDITDDPQSQPTQLEFQ